MDIAHLGFSLIFFSEFYLCFIVFVYILNIIK
ncbi:unknown [Tannerella sp. CAG:118]|nr:unknown [Tannerella sp. CAG:118]